MDYLWTMPKRENFIYRDKMAITGLFEILCARILPSLHRQRLSKPEKLIKIVFRALIEFLVQWVAVFIKSILHPGNWQSGRNRNTAEMQNYLPERGQAKDPTRPCR